MADRGHELTDELLKELEKRVAEEYGTALREMEKKVREYFEALDAQDAVQRQLLEDGKITQKEYNDWRYRHTMIGKRWEALRDALAEDMHHTNEIAHRIARDGMADVCALNHNYAVYQVEHDGELETGLAMYDRDTADYLLAQERETMPGPSTKKAAEIAANKDLQWNKQKIQSALFQGIMLGDSPYDIARRLQGVAQMNYNAAVRYARTMTTNAQNAGRYEAFREATDLGVELTIEWSATLDNRTRHDHRMMHGQRRAVDEPFITPDGFYILWPAQTKYGSSDVPQRMIWNCRCTLLSWVKGFEPDTVTSSPKMGDMTFEEWLYAKPMTKQQQDDWIRAGKPDVKQWKWKDIHRMAANASTDREQFSRYSNVLGDLAPKDLASFQKVKYTDKDGWTELKREYRIVNQYKVDSGSMTPREILWLDNRTITEKRTQFSSKYKYSGNIAGAYLDGKKDEMFFAHSKMADSIKGYRGSADIALLSENRRFSYIDVLKDDGTVRTDTFNDTEAKLFEFFADLYATRPFHSITMLSERGMCDSCKGVMEQFQEIFPDVEINVVSNKRVEGAVWKFRWRKKG